MAAIDVMMPGSTISRAVQITILAYVLSRGLGNIITGKLSPHNSQEIPTTINATSLGLDDSCNSIALCDCRMMTTGLLVNCSNCNLTHVPVNLPRDTIELILSYNRLRDIPTGCFQNVSWLKSLDLSYNIITKFKSRAFEGLHQLESLVLEGNSFNVSGSSFADDVFVPLSSLIYLNLKSGRLDIHNDFEYPDRALGQLQSLQILRIDGLTNRTFGIGVRNLASLQTIDLSVTKKFTSISKDAFKNFRDISIKTLNLSSCDLTFIHGEALYNLPNIDTIDYNNNLRLEIKGVGLSTKGLRNSTIRILFMQKVHDPISLTIITQEDFQYLKETQLQELYVDNNTIGQLGPGVPKSIPMSLRVMSCSFNVIQTTLTQIFYLLQLPNLQILIASFQESYLLNNYATHYSHSLHSKPRREVMCPVLNAPSTNNRILHGSSTEPELQNSLTDQKSDRSSLSDFAIHIPPKLWRVRFSHTYKLSFPIPPFEVLDSIVSFADFSYNLLHKWIGPVKGLERLIHLDLSGNNCDYVSPTFFGYCTGLETLIIAFNQLGPDLDDRTFYNLTSLRHLDISHNPLETTGPNFFSRLTNLTTLNFSHNYLSSWDDDISSLTNLLSLNLSHNKFKYLPENLCRDLDAIKKHSNIYIDIHRNRLECVCDTEDFVVWLSKTTVSFINLDLTFCKLPNGTKVPITQNKTVVMYLQIHCRSYAALIGISSACLGVFIVFLSVSMVYRNRWKLRYLYYMAVNKGQRTGYQTLEGTSGENPYFFDAFVSYEDSSQELVIRHILPRLEKVANLKLCIDKRDFVPGLYITDNIMNAIQNSKKTVVLLSKKFMKSKFCMYELNMARMEGMYTDRQLLIVVFLEEMPMRDSPREVLEIIQSQTYIEKPNDQHGEELFWERLVSSIDS